jgi:hypothetical protein
MKRKLLDLAPYRSDLEGFSRDILGIVPNPGQVRIFQAVQERASSVDHTEPNCDHPRYLDVVISAGNRAGKTTALAVIVLWHALYKKGLTLPAELSDEFIEQWMSAPYQWYHVSYEGKVAAVLHGEIRKILRGDHPGQRSGCPLTKAFGEIAEVDRLYESAYPYVRISPVFGGAEIHFRHTDERARALLGLNMHGISFDEVGFERYLSDVRHQVLHLRRLSTGGPIIWIGTPSLGFGDFYDLFREAESDGRLKIALRLSTRDNIGYGIDDRVFEDLVRSTPEYLRPQNIDGEFVADIGAYFEASSITRLASERAEIPDDARYVVGLDPAIEADDAVICVAAFTRDEIVIVDGTLLTGKKTVPQIVAATTEYWLRYGRPPVVVDATGLGGKMFRNELRHFGRLQPFDFAGRQKKKLDALANLRAAIDNAKLRLSKAVPPLFADETIRQLARYRLDDAKLRQDIVMTLAMIVWFTSTHTSGVNTARFAYY